MAKQWSEIRTENPAGPLTGAEITVAVQGGQSVGLTYQQLKDWVKFKNKLDATTDPAANDDSAAGYEAGSRWLNNAVSPKRWWICTDASEGAAVWDVLSLSEDELGTAALVNTGTGAGDVPLNSDLGSAAYAALAAQGGTVPETDRSNIFGGDQVIAGGDLIVDVNRGVKVDGAFIVSNLTDRVLRAVNASNISFFQFGKSRGLLSSDNGSAFTDFGVSTINGMVVSNGVGGAGLNPVATLEVRGTVKTGSYTVATLPSSPAEGARAYASDGLKSGETTGNGTGVPVYYSNGAWRIFRDDSAVTS